MIKIFYHICCLNNWKEIVRDQINKIIYSGLYDKCDAIYCFGILCQTPYKILEEYLHKFGSKFILKNTINKGNEIFTLKHIQSLILQDNECYILYIHTKGVTRYNNNHYMIDGKTYEIPDIYNNITDWRDFMEYHLIKEHTLCLDELKTNDIVGLNYVVNKSNLGINVSHFSGNFWWTRASYFKKLNMDEVTDPELFIYSYNHRLNPIIKILIPTSIIGYGQYFQSWPPNKYVDSILSSSKPTYTLQSSQKTTCSPQVSQSLQLLIDNNLTDKNTSHSYIELYERLFIVKKLTAKKVLEIGIGDCGEKNGGSIKLWSEYFKDATIYGLDILPENRVIDNIKNKSNIILYTETDAYDYTFVKDTFSDKGCKFDIIIDDGPHTLESMLNFIVLYVPLLTSDGILVIEDIPSIDWIDILKMAVPNNIQSSIEVYDLRHMKNRYDDIVFVINLHNKTI